MNTQQERELLSLILWLIAPDIAGQNADITKLLLIVKQNEAGISLKYNGLIYLVKLLRNDEGQANKIEVSRDNWKNSLYLDIIGSPKISF